MTCLRADVSYFLCCTRERDVVPFPLASPQTSFGVRLSRIHGVEMNACQTNPKGRLRGGYFSACNKENRRRLHAGNIMTWSYWLHRRYSMSRQKNSNLINEHALNREPVPLICCFLGQNIPLRKKTLDPKRSTQNTQTREFAVNTQTRHRRRKRGRGWGGFSPPHFLLWGGQSPPSPLS